MPLFNAVYGVQLIEDDRWGYPGNACGPDMGLTDMGLVDVSSHKLISSFVELV